MTRTFDEQALHIVTRQLEVAKKDNCIARNRNVEFRPSGHIYLCGERLSKVLAIQHIAAKIQAEHESKIQPQAIKKTKSNGITWDKLNQATKDFFFELAAEIFAATEDVDYENGRPACARLGRDIPKISLKNAPRLSNLKKAGMIEHNRVVERTGRWISLTEQGLATYRAMHA